MRMQSKRRRPPGERQYTGLCRRRSRQIGASDWLLVEAKHLELMLENPMVALRPERARQARLPRPGPVRQNVTGENRLASLEQRDNLIVGHQVDAVCSR